MATIDFPSSPTLNQTYIFNTKSWTWNGTGWVKYVPTGGLGSSFTMITGPFIEVGGLFAFPIPLPVPFTLLTHI